MHMTELVDKDVKAVIVIRIHLFKKLGENVYTSLLNFLGWKI